MGSRILAIGLLFAWLFPVSVAEALPSGLRSTWYRSARVVALADLAGFYGMHYREGPGSRITLKSQWSLLNFEAGARKVEYNGTLIWLHKPLVKSARGWSVDQIDVDKVVNPLLSGRRILSKYPVRVVMLDPGHGGRDHGATGPTGVEEKRVAADVAKRAKKHLEAAGFKVVLSRDGDENLELQQRTRRAKACGADVLVSIHLNAAASRVASGSESYVLTSPGGHSTASYSSTRKPSVTAYPGNRFDEASMALGFFLQRELVSTAGSADRGVRRGRLYVLKEAPCPSTLVELEFVSNRVQEGRMKAASWREKMAQAVARGIIEYAKAANGS